MPYTPRLALGALRYMDVMRIISDHSDCHLYISVLDAYGALDHVRSSRIPSHKEKSELRHVRQRGERLLTSAANDESFDAPDMSKIFCNFE